MEDSNTQVVETTQGILSSIHTLLAKVGKFQGSTGDEANAKAIELLSHSYKNLMEAPVTKKQRNLSGYSDR